ncbi:MAG: S1/P1 Nuclease [Sphingobacteriaceae bacterium]|nr:S1/P1 Nuclease [Sphingobacteriaceae bacterium]
MRRLLLFLMLAILLICGSWGFFGHQKINNLAVYTLPSGLISFYKINQKYITEHAADPDKRRYADTAEAPRHYLDVENYEKNIDSIPFIWKDAVNKYGLKKLNKSGILPWHIQRTYYNLVKAFKDLDSLKILKYSSDLGHYIGDAHVPLHTTENHNGQLTNQVGIHGFWESRIPELFHSNYNFWVGKAEYIENPLQKSWQIIKNSHSLVDSTLVLEMKLSKSFDSDKKFSFSERNNGLVMKQYSLEYSKAYQDALNGMVERQMRASIIAIGSYWYSAWIDAGQPKLTNFKKIDLNLEEIKENNKIEEKYKNGVLLGREI